MKKRISIFLILTIIMVMSAGCSNLSNNGENSASISVSEESVVQEEPASKEQVVKEFEEDANGEDETIDPDDFSDRTDNYEIEVLEDEGVEIQ